MSGTSLLALLDDIATILDDAALLTKVAAEKTAGVLGDDLALNAQQVSGVQADRELPVVWAVAKGSLLNKAILIPAALAISATCGWAISPILMLGGAYLCFEGFEKVLHVARHAKQDRAAATAVAHNFLAATPAEREAIERDKIRGAVRTDFVLSAEIVTIALGSVAKERFITQVFALSAIGIAMTVGVYGFVALIVKLDDLGYYLCRGRTEQHDTHWHKLRHGFGRSILRAAPWFMKALSAAGTTAMFLVGGGILLHAMPFGHWLSHFYATALPKVATLHTVAAALTSGLIGLAMGAIVFAAAWLIRRMRTLKRA